MAVNQCQAPAPRGAHSLLGQGEVIGRVELGRGRAGMGPGGGEWTGNGLLTSMSGCTARHKGAEVSAPIRCC